MKKLSLKNAKSMLSRKEMRAISGGYEDSVDTDCCGRQWRNYAPPLTGQYASVACSLTNSAAKTYASGGAGGGNYCCGSGCAGASWL